MNNQETFPLVRWQSSGLGHNVAGENPQPHDQEDGVSVGHVAHPPKLAGTITCTATETEADCIASSEPDGRYEQQSKSLPDLFLSSDAQGSDIDTAQVEISGWPRVSEELKGRAHRATFVLIDLMLGLVASLWLIFGIVAYAADSTVVDARDARLMEIARVDTTIFPYVFAAIVGRFLSAAARYWLERGSTLSTLDELCASNTLFSTVMTAYRHRALSITGVLTVVVWSLSPVGSQATQRVVSLQTRTENLTLPFSWADTMSPYVEIGAQINDSMTLSNSVDAVQSSAMMTPGKIQQSPIDQWNNVKIPMIERLGVGNPDWIPISDESTSNYSALVGIPVLDKDNLGASSFVINTTYWYADCFNFSSTIPLSLGASALTNYTDTNVKAWIGANGLWQITVDDWDENSNISGPLSFEFQIVGVTIDTGFGDPVSAGALRSLMTCNLTTSSVDVEVICDKSSNCQASAISYSSSHVPDQFIVPSSSFYPSGTVIDQYFTNFVNSFTDDGSSISTIFEWYLTDPIVNPFSHNGYYAALSNTTADDYSVRLSQVFNTYWLSSIFPISITSGLDPRAETYFPLVVNGTRTKYVDVQYLHCDKTWLALLIVSSTVLCLISFATGILRFFLRGPEILDLVSALTRPNVLQMPQNVTYLDGDHRVRLLGHRRVRLGSIVGKDDMSRIVIGDENGVARLQNHRPYF